MQAIEKTAHHWAEIPSGEVSDAIIAAFALGGIDHLFFTSGAEIVFYQEAIAKAHALGQPAPRLITMIHEHAGLNAALGYAAVSGKPVATAVHVDAGTYNYGGAIHTAHHSGLPVVITAGTPPTSYPGSMKGARDRGGHLWLQQSYDQNGIVRNYVKWDHRLDYQDNPGLIASRALQVALTEPRGPVYLSIPRELSFMELRDTTFPTAQQLGIARPAAPDPDALRDIARRLVGARNPFVVLSGSGVNPATFDPLVELCELLGLPAVNSVQRHALCFPKNHPLWLGRTNLSEADVVLVLQANVPWVPGPTAPGRDAYVAVIDNDPAKLQTPTYEFTADVRVTSDPLLAIRALTEAVEHVLGASDRSRIAERNERYAEKSRVRWKELEERALSRAKLTPIDPIWVTYNLGQLLGEDSIELDETLAGPEVENYIRPSRAGGQILNPASSGGWAAGAAFGAKLAAPDKDVVATTGDGFYGFSTANAALWAAAHYKAPFMSVIYQNRSYSTGTLQVSAMYPESYAAKVEYDGGIFDPPIDYAKEAEACGAYGENVSEPAAVPGALRRGLEATRHGQPAVLSFWLPRLDERPPDAR